MDVLVLLFVYLVVLLAVLMDPRPGRGEVAREWLRIQLFGPNRLYLYWCHDGHWRDYRVAAVTAGWYRHDVVAASPPQARYELFDGPRPTKFAFPLIGPGRTLIQHPVMVSAYEGNWVDDTLDWREWHCDGPTVLSDCPLTREELELIRTRDKRKG